MPKDWIRLSVTISPDESETASLVFWEMDSSGVEEAVSAEGRPTVKLSDNPNKAMGPADEIERYKHIFGVGEQKAQDVMV